MRVLQQRLIWLLLALWWPATLHCQIEQAFEQERPACEHACHPESGHKSVPDSCALFEDALYSAPGGHLALPPPQFVLDLWVSLVVPPPETVAPTVIPDLHASAPPWVPCWHFVRRASPLSRAPSLVLG